jgi:hypothetical protein
MAPKKIIRKPAKPRRTFSRYFTSTKGNVFDAHDYGYRCWPIGKSS